MAGEIIQGHTEDGTLVQKIDLGSVEQDGDQYEVSHLQTDDVKIQDPGVGQAVVLRHFFFRSMPVPPGQVKPSKNEIFSQFKNLIRTNLWADGLTVLEDKHVQMYTKKSVRKVSKQIYAEMIDNNADFVIICMAVPSKGVLLHETPQLAT